MANQSTTLIPSITSAQIGISETLPILSERAKGCGYAGQSNGVHTVQYTTVNGFTGLIKIQGSLATAPEEADWYDIVGLRLGTIGTPIADATVTQNFFGNHVWVRAIVTDFTAGEINRVLYAHN